MVAEETVVSAPDETPKRLTFESRCKQKAGTGVLKREYFEGSQASAIQKKLTALEILDSGGSSKVENA